jgi:pimeloyl-ACP methyl ester carboxylesterase
MRFVDVRGASIGFEEVGTGPPLVLLHGLPGDSRFWGPQLQEFASDHTVIAWDAPGCGRSPAPADELTTEDIGAYLVGFLDALRIEQPDVVGLSWGGGIALELLRQAPGVVRSLVLTGAYAGWAGSLPPDVVEQRLHAYQAAADAPGPDALAGWASGFFSPDAPASVVDRTLRIASEFQPRAFASLASSFAETDLRDVLATIDVPTLLLHGGADVRSPLTVARALHAAIPGASLEILSGVGHIANLEAPTEFNRVLRDFLARR